MFISLFETSFKKCEFPRVACASSADTEAINYINAQMEDEAVARDAQNAAATATSNAGDGSVVPIPGARSAASGARDEAFSVDTMGFKALEALPRAQVAQSAFDVPCLFRI